jgi:hypothetical protein
VLRHGRGGGGGECNDDNDEANDEVQLCVKPFDCGVPPKNARCGAYVVKTVEFIGEKELQY